MTVDSCRKVRLKSATLTKERPIPSIAICSPDNFSKLLEYDARSGLLWWCGKTRGRRSAQPAGTVIAKGYRIVRLHGKNYFAHRLIWFLTHGRWPTILDHIDGNRANNRLENLREATPAQNAQNSRRRSNNQSGFKGISWHAASGKWQAQIMAFGDNIHLGLFSTKEEAALAYDFTAIDLHGEFARINSDA